MGDSAKPIVVINRRHLPNYYQKSELQAYNEAYTEVSEHMLKNVPGVVAFFQSNDVHDKSMVHDVQIFKGLDSFMAHADMDDAELAPKMMNWLPKYDKSIPFKGHVFGSWNSKVRQMTVDIGKADFQFVPRSAGFIKTTADGIAGPPVIVYNHRRVLPGKMVEMLAAMQSYAAHMRDHVPGVMAITAGVDAKDPSLVHDLQIFANFEVFAGHVDMNNPTVKKLLFNWINFEKYDASTPFYGEVWATRDKIEAIRAMTKEVGNAEFTMYPIEDALGGWDLNKK